MTPDALVALASGTAGTITTLAFFLVAFMRGWVHSKSDYDDLKADRDFWRATAWRTLGTTEKLAPVIDTEVRRAP